MDPEILWTQVLPLGDPACSQSGEQPQSGCSLHEGTRTPGSHGEGLT